jgi:hypothetical protein
MVGPMRILAFARVAALAAAAALASPGGASAQEGVFMKDFLGSIGIIPKERPPIEYRERAPLVLPPQMELRAPADPRAIQASNPQWPSDPDVIAARRRAQEASLPVTQTEKRRLDQNPTLSIHEIRQGRRPGAEIPNAPVVRRGDNVRDALIVSPDEMRSQGRIDDTRLSSMEEPERGRLTEPPGGLRKPTQKVKATFEVEHRTDEADPKAYWREQAARR